MGRREYFLTEDGPNSKPPTLYVFIRKFLMDAVTATEDKPKRTIITDAICWNRGLQEHHPANQNEESC